MKKGRAVATGARKISRAEEVFGFLRRRSLIFFNTARRLFREGHYDVAAFNAEQGCQLHLKYHIALRLGDFTRTHSLSVLLEEFGKAAGQTRRAGAFLRRNALVLDELERAYISSRYIPMKYGKDQAARMLGFCATLRRFLEGAS